MTDPVPAGSRSRARLRIAHMRRALLLHPTAIIERVRELRRRSRPPLPADEHLAAAVTWLKRAQDVTREGGISRAYGMAWIPYMRRRGWQPPYPETTGYIIPTLYELANRRSDPALAERATRAAHWLITVQMPSGAIPGGTVSATPTPAAFNTGQVVFGWLAALARTGDETFAAATRRGCDYLIGTLNAEGLWPPSTAPYARGDSTLYNARTAWALAEAGSRLGAPEYTEAARRSLRAVVERQLPNGWIANCCLSDPARPLLHTLAYAIRGLIEGGRVLGDADLVRAGAHGAKAVASRVRADGWMAGRFTSDWNGAVRWSCLTGEAQMTNVWLRLAALTGESSWLEPVPRVIDFLLRVHDVSGRSPDLRGGVRGSWPVHGGYGPYEVLSWGTKFFCDALLRWSDAQRKIAPSSDAPLALA